MYKFKFSELFKLIKNITVKDLKQECGGIILSYCNKEKLTIEDFKNLEDDLINFSHQELITLNEIDKILSNYLFLEDVIFECIELIGCFWVGFFNDNNKVYINKEHCNVIYWKKIFDLDGEVELTNQKVVECEKKDVEIINDMIYKIVNEKNILFEGIETFIKDLKNENFISKNIIQNWGQVELTKLIECFYSCQSMTNIKNSTSYELSTIEIKNAIDDFSFIFLDSFLSPTTTLLFVPIEVVNIRAILNRLSQYKDNFKKFADEDLINDTSEKNKTPILNFLKKIKDDKIRISLIDKYNAEVDIYAEKIEEYFPAKDDRRFFQKILKIPFDNYSELNYDIKDFYNKINNTHYGMNKIKDKLAEIMLVLSRNKDSSPPIICLVGAPGVGKTSLIHSIGEAANRKISKISLNVAADIESLLSGFSSTYRNSQNGRITESLIKTGVKNPLIILDEIDKVQNVRGNNIENALLGLLDPSQNTEFYDEYFGFNFDVSKVMFICTANSIDKLSKPLLDRMMIIDVDGYTDTEKFIIAETYLMNRIIKKNGILKSDNFNISNEAIKYIIDKYCNESGIRNIEQILDSICKKYLFEKEINNHVLDLSINNLVNIIEQKPIMIKGESLYRNSGILNGLYCYEGGGGGILKVQSSIVNGDGRINNLGLLGKKTTNSVQVIYNLLKLNQINWGLPDDLFKTKNICINYGGSNEVDGPSAGTATVCSVVSSIKNISVSRNIGMSGEIDLHGNVLPIGGCRDKIMGSKKEGVTKFFFPIDNKYDIDKLDIDIKNGVEIVLVSRIEEILLDLGLINS